MRIKLDKVSLELEGKQFPSTSSSVHCPLSIVDSVVCVPSTSKYSVSSLYEKRKERREEGRTSFAKEHRLRELRLEETAEDALQKVEGERVAT